MVWVAMCGAAPHVVVDVGHGLLHCLLRQACCFHTLSLAAALHCGTTPDVHDSMLFYLL